MFECLSWRLLLLGGYLMMNRSGLAGIEPLGRLVGENDDNVGLGGGIQRNQVRKNKYAEQFMF